MVTLIYLNFSKIGSWISKNAVRITFPVEEPFGWVSLYVSTACCWTSLPSQSGVVCSPSRSCDTMCRLQSLQLKKYVTLIVVMQQMLQTKRHSTFLIVFGQHAWWHTNWQHTFRYCCFRETVLCTLPTEMFNSFAKSRMLWRRFICIDNVNIRNHCLGNNFLCLTKKRHFRRFPRGRCKAFADNP